MKKKNLKLHKHIKTCCTCRHEGEVEKYWNEFLNEYVERLIFCHDCAFSDSGKSNWEVKK